MNRINRRDFIKKSTGALSFFSLPLVLTWINSEAHAGAESTWRNTSGSFSFVTIPDVHLDYKCSGEHLLKMAQWIVSNAQERNMHFVAQLGDLGDRRGDGTIKEMLHQARLALEPVNQADIPLTVCIGNHDYDETSSVRETECWNQPNALGKAMYSGKPWFGGTFEEQVDEPGLNPGGTINHYMTLDVPGTKLLLLTLELAPRDKVMDWAEDLVLNRHPSHDVIVFTHSYLHLDGQRVTDGTRFNPKDYSAFSTQPGPEYTNDGLDLWQKYFRSWPNLRMVHSGHAINEPTQAYKISTGDKGNNVAEFFYNWQNWGFDVNAGRLIPGQGTPYQATMLKIFDVDTRANRVVVQNLMPVLGESGEAALPDSFDWS